VCEEIGEGGPQSKDESAQLKVAFMHALGEHSILSYDQLLQKLCDTVQRQTIDLFRNQSGMGAGERVQDLFFQGFWVGSRLALNILNDGKIVRCNQEICEYLGGDFCPLHLSVDITWQLEKLATQPEFCGGVFEGIASAWKAQDTNTHLLCHLSTEAFKGVRDFSMSLENRLPEILNRGIDDIFDEHARDSAELRNDQKAPAASHSHPAATRPSTVTRACFSCKRQFPKSRFSSSQLRKKSKAKCLTCVNTGQLVQSAHKQDIKSKPAPKATSKRTHAQPPAPKAATKRAQAQTVPPVEPEEEEPPPLPLCCICMHEIKTHAFLPCGHLITCATCSEQVMATTGACPVCRAPATMVARIYSM